MKLFNAKRSAETVSCQDVVAAYGDTLKRNLKALPFDPELIKAALVYTAATSTDEQAVAVAKSAFVLLNSHTGKFHKADISTIASLTDEEIERRLDLELDALEDEFDRRFALARSLIHA